MSRRPFKYKYSIHDKFDQSLILNYQMDVTFYFALNPWVATCLSEQNGQILIRFAVCFIITTYKYINHKWC